MNNYFLAIAVLIIFLPACGVKGPPLPPEKDAVVVEEGTIETTEESDAKTSNENKASTTKTATKH